MRLDDAVEQVAADETKVAVNSREGTLDESPVVGIKVWKVGVGVMEVGDSHYEG